MIFQVVLVLTCVSLGFSLPYYADRIPNGHNVMDPCDPSQTWPAVGHTVRLPNGFQFHLDHHNNQFGLDFAAAGHHWVDALCRKDSDGDGKTNGEELGDPNCHWQKGDTPDKFSSGHPGFDERTCIHHIIG